MFPAPNYLTQSAYKTFDIFEGMRKNKPVYQPPKELIPSNCCGFIFGKPGVGKTFLISKLLKNQYGFNKKFDIILIVSPSAMADIPAHPDYWNDKFSVDWVQEKLIFHRDQIELMKLEEAKKRGSKKFKHNYESDSDQDTSTSDNHSKDLWNRNNGSSKVISNEGDLTREKERNTLIDNNHAHLKALVIWDDQMAHVKENEHNTNFTDLIANRRHIIPGVIISHIFTGQVQKRIPKWLRDLSTWVCCFPTNIDTMKSIVEENSNVNFNSVKNRIKKHFEQDEHNFIYICHDSIWANFAERIS